MKFVGVELGEGFTAYPPAEAVLGVEAQGHRLGLADEVDGVDDFLLEAWPGVGEHAFQGEGDVLGWGHDVLVYGYEKARFGVRRAKEKAAPGGRPPELWK